MAVSVEFIVKIALLALVAAAVIYGVVRLRRGIKRTVNTAEVRAVREILDYVAEKGLDYEAEPEHPRLVSNMNKIYRPRIEAEFPDFDWGETKRYIESEIRKRYEDSTDFEISETVISRYEKSAGSRVITTESAASCAGEEGTRHFAVVTELSFINFKKLDSTGNEQPRALICPGCGAPLTRAGGGDVICEYCGTIVVGEKTWQITDIREK